MPLTDMNIRTMLPMSKRFRKADEGGLFLEVAPNGTKRWKLAYRFEGGQRSAVLGVYPQLSLEKARSARDKAKMLLKQGKDPFPKVEVALKAVAGPAPDTWSEVAKEFRDRRVMQGAAPMTVKKMEILIRKTLPGIGDRPVKELTPIDILPLLRAEEANGHFESANRLRTLIGQIFRYVVATGRATADQTRDLKGAILPPDRKHNAGLVKKSDVGGLMRAIRGHDGNPIITSALLLIAYTFVVITHPPVLRAFGSGQSLVYGHPG